MSGHFYKMETGVILLKGDLVEFTAPEIFSDAKREYKNPGIVLETYQKQNFLGQDSLSALVHWADGRQTSEHFCYLKKISSKLSKK